MAAQDVFGSFIPKVAHGKRSFEWQHSRLIEALCSDPPAVILFEDLNLAPPQVLQLLVPFLDIRQHYYHPEGVPQPIDLTRTIIIATRTVDTSAGGAPKLPASIESLFVVAELEDVEKDEMYHVACDHLSKIFDPDKSDIDESILDIHMQLPKRLLQQHTSGGEQDGEHIQFNLRDIIKFCECFEALSKEERMNVTHLESGDKRVATYAALLVYAESLFVATEQDVAREMICSAFGVKYTDLFPANLDVAEGKVGDLKLTLGTFERGDNVTGSERSGGFVHTSFAIRQLQRIAMASSTRRMVLLEGATCSSKTSLVVELARLARQKLIIVSLHSEIEVSDLLGGFAPTITGPAELFFGPLNVVLGHLYTHLSTSDALAVASKLVCNW
jgi:midasin (ATPase involved in ribosome maturation)